MSWSMAAVTAGPPCAALAGLLQGQTGPEEELLEQGDRRSGVERRRLPYRIAAESRAAVSATSVRAAVSTDRLWSTARAWRAAAGIPHRKAS